MISRRYEQKSDFFSSFGILGFSRTKLNHDIFLSHYYTSSHNACLHYCIICIQASTRSRQIILMTSIITRNFYSLVQFFIPSRLDYLIFTERDAYISIRWTDKLSAAERMDFANFYTVRNVISLIDRVL